MANRLVIRYYPVEGDYGAAWFAGLSTWVAEEGSVYDDTRPHTMGVMGDELYYGFVGSGKTVSATMFDDSLGYGSFMEKEIILIDSENTVIPITESLFPIEMFISGMGDTVERDSHNRAWLQRWGMVIHDPPTFEDEYSGGVLEVGAYIDGDYQGMGTLWVSGSDASLSVEAFQSAGAGERSAVLFNTADGPTIIIGPLGGGGTSPAPAKKFWTGLKSAHEVIEEGGGSQDDGSMVAFTAGEIYGSVGFSLDKRSQFGVAETTTVKIGGLYAKVTAIKWSEWQDGIGWVEVEVAGARASEASVTLKADGLVHELEFSYSSGGAAYFSTAGPPAEPPFIGGERYEVELNFAGDIEVDA